MSLHICPEHSHCCDMRLWSQMYEFQTHLIIVLGLFNTLRPKQDGHHIADNIFRCILLNEDIWILINISLKFGSEG